MKPTAKILEIALLGLFVVLCLVSGRLLLNWLEYQSLLEESALDESLASVQSSGERLAEDIPRLDDLLVTIDECVEIFRTEDVNVRSYNLEDILNEGNNASLLHSASIRFKLQGPWQGIEKGLIRVEGIGDQAIGVEEAALGKGGGEVLLKIYFVAPDNFSSP
ncbi:hypothetical protein Desdi_2446 [Desulfitobacterium dichloroeliminans LMG P-21439]|uniref:Uncharacterized protein n=1 Tax=Desulfitobacterium dichloroeliminans (strain LMG P-21439 / DCA1) TaxID=871963 RepID=L0FA08_DESDL|nr:hypothetical protein [Desulfitobacterium dichloroeliminans]AGA69870.1 hypothetical protein Desdi_2446 [Desulfitobacterium dichloroeliminans LMG P-21439]